MSLWVFISRWRRGIGLVLFGLTVAGLVLPATADSTNTAKVEPRKLREDLIKGWLQEDMFRKWGSAHDSLGGQMLPPVSRPTLSPTQMRELKEQMDAQRYWMFADPADAGNAPTLEERLQLDRSAPGLLDGMNAAMPRVLQRYYDRQAHGRAGETNGLASDDRNAQDDLSGRREDRWRIKSGRSKTPEVKSHSVFEPVETAASKAISRLFQPNGGRELAVPAGGGLFSEVFTPPAAIPMERTPETIQRRSDFQKLLESPGTPAAAKIYSPLPGVTPGASGFGGLNNFAAPAAGSGLSSPAGGSSLLGASSVPTVAAPPSVISQFQPVTPPRRRF